MAERDFFGDAAKRRVTEAIGGFETQTSAELIVAVHHRAASYRHADYLVGFVVAWITLLLLIVLPQEFALWTFPVEVAVAFVAGALVSSHLAPLRVLLTPRAARESAVRAEACEAFVRLGVAKTKRRTGLLVFVAMYERRAMVIADSGIDPSALGEPWTRALAGVDAAAHARDFERFLASLDSLASALATTLPHHDGDANELPNTVDAA